MTLDEYGNPEAVTCRHCGGGKRYLRGARLCTPCDSPNPGGLTIRATWDNERPAA